MSGVNAANNIDKQQQLYNIEEQSDTIGTRSSDSSVFATLDINEDLSVDKNEAKSKIDLGLIELDGQSIFLALGNNYGEKVKQKVIDNNLLQNIEDVYNVIAEKFSSIKYDNSASSFTPTELKQASIDVKVNSEIGSQVSDFVKETNIEYSNIIAKAMEEAKAELLKEKKAKTKQSKVSPKTNITKTNSSSIGKDGQYKIQSGDTLSKIAKANGTTVSELMKLNPQIKNADLIYAGRNLKLPNKTEQPDQSEQSNVLDEVVVTAEKPKPVNLKDRVDVEQSRPVVDELGLETPVKPKSSETPTVKESTADRTPSDNGVNNPKNVKQNILNRTMNSLLIYGSDGQISNIETDISGYDKSRKPGDLPTEMGLTNALKLNARYLGSVSSSEIKDKDGTTIVSYKSGNYYDGHGKEITQSKAERLLKKANKDQNIAKLIQNK